MISMLLSLHQKSGHLQHLLYQKPLEGRTVNQRARQAQEVVKTGRWQVARCRQSNLFHIEVRTGHGSKWNLDQAGAATAESGEATGATGATG